MQLAHGVMCICCSGGRADSGVQPRYSALECVICTASSSSSSRADLGVPVGALRCVSWHVKERIMACE
jgi:hypothetical protein